MPIEGAWISAAHLVKCLGVPRAALREALLGKRVSYLITGREPRQSIRVKAADAFAEWPFAASGGEANPNNTEQLKSHTHARDAA